MHNNQQALAVGDTTGPVPDDWPSSTATESTVRVVPPSELADISSVNQSSPCLVLLRRNETPDAAQTPLVIGHSLFGDTAQYNLWCEKARVASDIYVLRHRGLDSNNVFSPDSNGGLKMIGEYAAALVVKFGLQQFDMLGASFGAVLSLHVANTTRKLGGCPRRLILIDPPPMMPKELHEPHMLDVREAAHLLVMLYLGLDYVAIDVRQQLNKLPTESLPYFLGAQLMHKGVARDRIAARVAH